VNRLRESLHRNAADVVELGTAGLGLLDIVEGYDRLILVDAIQSGAPPGTVHELRGDELANSANLGPGHDADLPAVLAFGDKLARGRMPRDVVVIAVEGVDVSTVSDRLTPDVEAAVPVVVRLVEEMVGQALAT